MPTQVCGAVTSNCPANQPQQILADLLKIADVARGSGNKAKSVEAITAVYAHLDIVQFCADEEALQPPVTSLLDCDNHLSPPSIQRTAALRWGLGTEAAAHIVMRCISRSQP